MNRTLAVVFALLCLASARASGSHHFRWANPTPQGNELRALAAESEQTAYAVGIRGTVLRTADGGDTWADLTDFNAFSADLNDVVVISPGVLMAAGESPGLFRSDDAGRHWAAVDNPAGVELWNIEAVVPGVLSAIGEGGEVLRSADGGETWTRLTPTGATRLTQQFWHSPVAGYVVGEYQGRVTDDGGLTWNLIPGFGEWEAIDDVVFLDALHGYLIADFNTWETLDGGMAWEDHQHLLNEPIYQHEALFLEEERRLVITDLEGAGLWQTLDNGESWEILYQRESAGGFLDIEPLTPDRLLMVSTDGDLLVTTDAAVSWTNFTHSFGGEERVDFRVIAHLPGNVLLVGGEPYVTADNPNLWLRSQDGGDHWFAMDVYPEIENLYDMDHWGDELVMVVGSGGHVARSLDGGHAWETGIIEEPAGLLDAVSVPSATTAFVLTRAWNASEVYRTIDQGATWHRRDTGLPSTGDFYDLFFVDENVGFACGGMTSSPEIYGTIDGGGLWTRLAGADQLLGTLHTMHWFSPTTGLVAGYYRIFRTTDGGASFTEVDLSDGARCMHFHDDLHGVASDVFGSVRTTADGGQTWEPVPVPNLSQSRILSMPSGFLMTGDASLIIQAAREPAGVTAAPRLTRASIHLSSSPNPFSEGCRIHYRAPEGGVARVEIFDVVGRRVRLLRGGPLPQAAGTLSWDGRDDAGRLLPGGAYLARVRADREGAARRVTLIRR